MSWPKERKRETRERIVEAAAAAFREHGVDKVGVAEVMRRAGLTHGGFYAHFASKEDLLAETVTHAVAQVTTMLKTLLEADAFGNKLLKVATAYFSPAH